MTAINFPASPSPGDKWPTTGNIDGKVWAWDGTTWKIVSTNGTVTIIDNTARSFAFTVTYTNVPGSYNVVGTDRNGEVNGLNPTITVNEEDTLIFNVNASGHPFYLVWQHGGSSNQVGGGQGTNTASNQGTVNGTVTWVTDVGDGDALPTGELFYYQCGTHANMYGTIKVLLKNTSDSASHIHDLIDLDDTPNAYDNGKYLKSTATGTQWATVSGGTTYGVVTDQEDGLAPQLPSTDANTKYLRGDGTWQVVSTGGGVTYDLTAANGSIATEEKIVLTGTDSSEDAVILAVDASSNLSIARSNQTITFGGGTYDVFQGTDSGLVPASSSGTTDKFLRSDGTWQLVSSGGSADGNDYVTGANLGTGADAKVLTLSFSDTSLNQTVDLASIDTQFTTEFGGTTKGLVPDGSSAGNNKFLKSDGSWGDAGGGQTNQNAFSTISVSGSNDVDADDPEDTLTFVAQGAMTITTNNSSDTVTFSSTNTTYGAPTTSAAGLVPSLPLSEGTTKYLRGDGSWHVVSTGSADGNDYVTNASLGSGGNAKVLTLSFSDTSKNQTVDLSSIDTQFTTEFGGTTKGLVPDGSSAGNNKFLKSDGSWDDVSAGETNQFAFSKIAVSGQSDVDAENKTDTLTFEAAGAMTITTDNSSDKVTFSSTNTTYTDFQGTSRGLVPNGSSAGNNKFLKSDGSWDDVGTGDTNQNAFSTFKVSGQSNVTADGPTDEVTFIAQGGMTITTNQSSDQITFSSQDTTYGNFQGSAAGLVPNGSSAGNDKFLKSDGSWDYAGGTATIQTDTGNAMHNLVFVDNVSSGSQTLKIDNASNSLCYNPSSNRLIAYETQSYRMVDWSSNPGYGTSGQFPMSKGSSGWVWSTHVSQNTSGELYLKRTTTYREGGHIQFEDQDGQSNTFAIDVYSDNGTNAEEMIRIIDQENNMQRFAVNHAGAWGIGHTNPDFGDTGEVMISRGSGQPPYWGNHSNISGSSFATAAQGTTADTANAEIDHIYSQLIAIGNDDTITTVAELKTALLSLVRN